MSTSTIHVNKWNGYPNEATRLRLGGTLRRGRRGSAVIESALVILPFLALMCAIIDFSMAIFIRNSLLNAVREGTRYAVTSQTGAGGFSCQDSSVKNVVQQFAMGILAGSTGLSKININYYDPVTLADVSAATNSNAEGHIVRISVTGVSWLWMLNGIWQNVDAIKHGSGQQYTGLTIGAASSDIMEPPPNGISPCR